MRKATLTSILVSAALVLVLSFGAQAHQMGGSGMQHGMTGQQGAMQSYGCQGHGMGSGMMGGMGYGRMGGMGSGMMGHGMGQGKMGHGFGRHGNLLALKKSLDLSDEQFNSIYSIHLEARKDTIKRVADIKIEKLELRDMLRVSKVNMSAVKEKLNKIAKMKTELKLARIEKHEKVKSLLTEEQLEKFFKMNPRFMGRVGSHIEDSD